MTRPRFASVDSRPVRERATGWKAAWPRAARAQKVTMAGKPGARPKSEMKSPQTRMERAGGRCTPFRSWIQPMPGWAREETALYTVMRRPAARRENPERRMRREMMAGRAGP
jgi:hypothetical protein